jgi:hypothetical protein
MVLGLARGSLRGDLEIELLVEPSLRGGVRQ